MIEYVTGKIVGKSKVLSFTYNKTFEIPLLCTLYPSYSLKPKCGKAVRDPVTVRPGSGTYPWRRSMLNLGSTSRTLTVHHLASSMSSNDQSGPSTVAHSVSQLILHAEPVHFVGKYRVLANQVRPHPGQRLLCQQWVDSLHERFKDVGLDRAAHPIKVILENNNGLEALTAQSTEAGLGVLSELPNNIAVLVYHGQHRIAACLKLEDLNEHWWYAEVYRQGTFLDSCRTNCNSTK